MREVNNSCRLLTKIPIAHSRAVMTAFSYNSGLRQQLRQLRFGAGQN